MRVYPTFLVPKTVFRTALPRTSATQVKPHFLARVCTHVSSCKEKLKRAKTKSQSMGLGGPNGLSGPNKLNRPNGPNGLKPNAGPTGTAGSTSQRAQRSQQPQRAHQSQQPQQAQQTQQARRAQRATRAQRAREGESDCRTKRQDLRRTKRQDLDRTERPPDPQSTQVMLKKVTPKFLYVYIPKHLLCKRINPLNQKMVKVIFGKAPALLQGTPGATRAGSVLGTGPSSTDPAGESRFGGELPGPSKPSPSSARVKRV